MTRLDRILEDFEAVLELERELGRRFVECDRRLLKEVSPAPAAPVAAERPAALPAAAPTEIASSPAYDFVFLHDRPLSEKGREMVCKITAAMGGTPEKNPVVVVPPLPKASIYVVLGALAMRRFFPGMAGSCGQWLKSESGEDVLVTNSPEFILRFGETNAAVRKIKQDMWNSLKTVLQRLGK